MRHNAIRIRQMPSQDRGPRRPRPSGSRSGAPRSSGPRTGGTGASRPRRDDDRPSRSRDDRPSSSRPRRDDARPSRNRDDRPSSGRSSSGRPSSDRPSSGRPFRERSERPSSSRPRRDDDRSSRSRDDRSSSGRPSSDRPSSGRPFRERSERPSSSRPRRDDDRPSRSRDDRPNSSRPSSSRPGTNRPYRERDDRPSRGRDDRSSSSRPSSSRPFRGRDDRSSRGRDDRRDAPARPQTAAQRKADEVHHRTGGRKYGKEPMPVTEHTIERWQDDGPVSGRSRRDDTGQESSPRRPTAKTLAHVEATVAKAIEAAVGADDAKRTIERFALALDAFERERYQDAKKGVMPIVKKCTGIPLVHEVAGLSLYRLGQWNDAADQLEQARAASHGSTTNHPVLADCYRALRRYEKVDELWKELKEASPHPSIVAEGRIVAAGALADHGDLQGAVRLMHHGSQDPRKVQEYHLREWYMLGDLYDRSGDVIAARKMFGRIAAHDPHFSDVRERLSTLGT